MKEIKTHRSLILLLGAVILYSCGEQVLEPPERLVPKEKMVEMLTDLSLINAAKTTNVAILRENGIEPMSYIFKKYGVDSAQFVQSDRYYASLPVEYEDIHTKVKERIEKQQEEVLQQKKINDSLKLLERERKKSSSPSKMKKEISKITDSLQ